MSKSCISPRSLYIPIHAASSIKKLLANWQKMQPDAEVQVFGWVRTVRKQKDIAFAHISDGSTPKQLQAVFRDRALLDLSLQTGCAVKVAGRLAACPARTEQPVELIVEKCNVVGACPPISYPFSKKYHSEEFIREHLHLRMRTRSFLKVAQVRSMLFSALHRAFSVRHCQ